MENTNMQKSISMEEHPEIPQHEGVRQVVGAFSGKNVSCAIVVSRFNMELTSKLADSAIQALCKHGVDRAKITVIWVPGAYEIPTIAGELAKNGRFDAIIALGVVVQGETQHAPLINQHIALALGRLSLDYSLPVIYEVISAHSIAQADDRCSGGENSRGWYAALAALEMVEVLKKIRN